MKKYLLILLLIAITLVTGYYFVFSRPTASNLTIIQIGQLTIPVEVATAPAEQEKGLSGRASLPAGDGMIFVFPQADYHQFWMPDMHFPIDIIWINNNQVVDITSNASNIFDPKNPIFYIPKSPAQYVLEVNAGFAEKNNIKIGNPIKISP